MRNIKMKLYSFVLEMMLKDYVNGKLLLTGKQKSQVETLIWKVKYKLI